jgi:thiosulfate dehydrogenase
MHARIDREMPTTVPLAADEVTFTAGASIYVEDCASCHGLPGRDVAFARRMMPAAPQLFARHGTVVGVSDDPPGETYWKVANGIRLSGMPAFKDLLDDKRLWQATLLVAHADKLPPQILEKLAPPR